MKKLQTFFNFGNENESNVTLKMAKIKKNNNSRRIQTSLISKSYLIKEMIKNSKQSLIFIGVRNKLPVAIFVM